MELHKLESSLARVTKGEVSSLDALAAIAGALLEMAKEIDAIGRIAKVDAGNSARSSAETGRRQATASQLEP
jgi:hypothetical protein